MKTTILDGRHTYEVTVVDPDRTVHVSGERSGKSASQEFLKWWAEEARRRKAPALRPTGEDFGIANRLLKKYGRERLEYLSKWFWRMASAPILEEGYPHQLRLFAAKLPEVEAEVQK